SCLPRQLPDLAQCLVPGPGRLVDLAIALGHRLLDAEVETADDRAGDDLDVTIEPAERERDGPLAGREQPDRRGDDLPAVEPRDVVALDLDPGHARQLDLVMPPDGPQPDRALGRERL